MPNIDARKSRLDAEEPSLSVRFGPITHVLDSFTPPGLSAEGDDAILRARILIAINLVFVVTMAAILLAHEIAIDMPGLDRPLARVLLGSLSAGLLAALMIYRVTGSLPVASNLTLVSIYIALVSAVTLQGGFRASPSLAVYLVLPVISSLFNGRSGGLVWSAVVVSTWASLYLLDRSGFPFPGVLPPETRDFLVLVNLACASMGISIVVAINQSLNQRLRDALTHERMMLVHQAGHDPLTDLANRRKFNELMTTAIQRATRVDRHLAIVVLDLNGFKPINDRYGHSTGDAVLQEVSRRLRHLTRATDSVARMGGDEFAILMELIESLDGVAVYLQTIQQCISEPHRNVDDELSVSASIGVSIYPEDGRDAESLLCLADDAMYHAKATSAPYCFASDLKKAIDDDDELVGA